MTKLFKKKTKELKTTAENIIFEQLLSDEDAIITNLAVKLKEGSPLVLNFEKLEPTGTNKVIAFLSGFCFSIGGEVRPIKNLTYLFCNHDAFDDGSLQELLNNI